MPEPCLFDAHPSVSQADIVEHFLTPLNNDPNSRKIVVIMFQVSGCIDVNGGVFDSTYSK